MKLSEHLDKGTRKKLNNLSNPKRKQKKKKRKTEKFSEKDLLDLMGVGRQTYVRGRGGAMRRK